MMTEAVVSTQSFAPHDSGVSGLYTNVLGPSTSTVLPRRIFFGVLVLALLCSRTVMGGSARPCFLLLKIVFRLT